MDKIISCDWGTSNFRLRLVVRNTREVLQEVVKKTGTASTHKKWKSQGLDESQRIPFYTTILSNSLQQFNTEFNDDFPIIISGMASSSIGMMEIPYQTFPFTWNINQLAVKKVESRALGHPIFLVSGFKTDNDVMRGEETILFGCEVDEADSVFIFPGTHSKHVFVKNKTAFNFKTYTTGELFNLLLKYSVLRNSTSRGEDEAAFTEGILQGAEGNILHELFMVRTRNLLQQKDRVNSYQFLSGILIGAELSSFKEENADIYIVTAGRLKAPYMKAAELLKISKNISWINSDKALINGHCKIAHHIS